MNTQIPKPVTASQYCWLFAAACVYDESIYKEGRVDVEMFKLFQRALKEKEYPPLGYVPMIFTRPYRTLANQLWSLEPREMILYWTQQHRDSRKEQTPVYYNMVAEVSTIHDTVSVYDTGANIHEKVNVHGYRLEKGNLVYTHGDIIAVPESWIKKQ